jgi:DNA helicase HerA-like ATPase
VNGLVVIDEAKEFVPSQRSTACKRIIMSFATMARKYGIGLLLASQELSAVDTKALNNCATKLFGAQTSPATVDTTRRLLDSPADLGIQHLKPGQFWLKRNSLDDAGRAPVKVRTPWCLTGHPRGSPEEPEILMYARESAERAAGPPRGPAAPEGPPSR